MKQRRNEMEEERREEVEHCEKKKEEIRVWTVIEEMMEVTEIEEKPKKSKKNTRKKTIRNKKKMKYRGVVIKGDREKDS